ETGVIFTAATLGILGSSLAAERLAKRYSQKSLITAGFVVTAVGIGVLLGLGVGVMLTPSVNVVQSSFPEEQQAEISGLSRSVSNLGSSFGTAIAGTILVSATSLGTRSYVTAMVVLVGFALVGLLAALRIPRQSPQPRT